MPLPRRGSSKRRGASSKAKRPTGSQNPPAAAIPISPPSTISLIDPDRSLSPAEQAIPPVRSWSQALDDTIMRRDGLQCLVCGDNGGIPENRLGCAMIAWHDASSEEASTIRWLKDTRCITVDFDAKDPMNIVTLCYACRFYYEDMEWRFIPTMDDLTAMLEADVVDQALCREDLAAGRPTRPRVWPQFSQQFEVFQMAKSEYTEFYIRRQSETYQLFSLPIHPYLALVSALDYVLWYPKEPIDSRHAEMRDMLERIAIQFDSRLPREARRYEHLVSMSHGKS